MVDGDGAHEQKGRDQAVDALLDSLLADGATTLTELMTTLRAQGHLSEPVDGRPRALDEPLDAVDEVLGLLASRDDIWISPAEIVAATDHVLRDIVLTHRVSADELDREVLDGAPDFAGFDVGRIEPFQLGGGTVERIFDDEDDRATPDGSFAGPSSWLDGIRPGDLVALRRDGDRITVELVETPADGTPEAAALRRAFDARVTEPGVGELIETLVLDALIDQPDLFRTPVAPLHELLAAAGLSCQQEWTGRAGEEWAPPYVNAAEAELDLVADRYLLDDCCLDNLESVMEMWNDLLLGAEPDQLPWDDIGRALGHGAVAAAFADLVLGDDPEPRDELDRFAETLVASSRKQAKAIGLFLLARNQERRGDALAVEAALETALRLDPDLEPALDDLAWHAADRGDVDKAINLLRRAGATPEDPQLRMLESMRPVRNAVGRNERCPCGSGRKYKDCCQRRGVRPLSDRARWVEHKLWSFALRPHRQHIALVLITFMSPQSENEVERLLESGLPMDLATFEAGLGEAFLAERGPLLPEDERELLVTWTRERRDLWEVVERAGASTVVLRRISTGDLVPVVGLDGSHEGEMYLARVAPLGDVSRVVGVPVLVPPAQRSSAEALVASDPDAWHLASWIGGVDVPAGAVNVD